MHTCAKATVLMWNPSAYPSTPTYVSPCNLSPALKDVEEARLRLADGERG